MERSLFPKAPFQKADVEKFVLRLHAEVKAAETAGEDVDRLKLEQQESIDGYAATLSEDEATELLLMCAAERLFLQQDPPAELPIRAKNDSANHTRAWMKLDLGALNPARVLPKFDILSLNPAVIGISIGIVLVVFVIVRVYLLFSS